MLNKLQRACHIKLGVSLAEATAISLAYFVQGVLSLTDLATSYYYKDLLHATPAQLSLFDTVAWLPWTAKPLYGLITDTVPIRGCKRKPYLLASGIIATLCFALLGVLPASLGTALALLTLLSLAIACSDVVVDGIVVERSRGQPAAIGGSLQSLCWGSRYGGSIITSWCGGLVVDKRGPRAAFLLSSVFPFAVAAAAAVLEEAPAPPSSPLTLQRMVTVMRIQVAELLYAVKQPHIAKPLLFMITAGCLPSASAAMFFYFTNHLGFSAEFMGHMETFAYVAAIAGVAAYNVWFKVVPVRRLMGATLLITTAISLARLLLVTGVNRDLGIPDKVFAAVDKALLNCVSELAFMPLLVLSARMCPEGVEATLFAALMSINNAATGIGYLLGSFLTWLLNISATDFSNLWMLLTITSCGTLVLIPLLRLIPKDLNSINAGRVSDDLLPSTLQLHGEEPFQAYCIAAQRDFGRTDRLDEERAPLVELAAGPLPGGKADRGNHALGEEELLEMKDDVK